MVVRIRITNIEAIGALRAQIHQVIGAAILDMDDDLRRNSPVKYGFFVNSWQSQANGQPPAIEGFDSLDRGASNPVPIFQGVKDGAVVSLVNTAIYGPKLADGYSPQAPAGWVESCANRLQDHVDRHVILSSETE